VEGLDILPVLLEERNEEVDAQHDVAKNLIIIHLDVADGNTQAEDLLELELDGGAYFGDLAVEVLRVGNRSREFSSLGETGTKETRDLLDQSLRGKESIVFLGELLDELLVFVELLQVVNGHVLKLNLLGAIDVGSIGENANRHTRTRDIGKLDGSRETLIPLGVVVLETNLELDGLDEVALLLAVGIGKEFLDGAPHA